MTPDLDRTLRDAIAALDSLGLRWAVVGGLAVSAWAVPRATRDVDQRRGSERVKRALEGR